MHTVFSFVARRRTPAARWFGFSWLCGIFTALLVFLAALTAVMADGQVDAATVITTHLMASPVRVHAGATCRLELTVQVQAGYHIQSAHPLDKFLIPTLVKPVPNQYLTFGGVVYPRAILIPASAAITSVGKLSVYENNVVISIPVFIKKNTPWGNLKLMAHFQAQACNDQTCFMPVKKTLITRIVVLPPLNAGGTGPQAAPSGQAPPSESAVSAQQVLPKALKSGPAANAEIGQTNTLGSSREKAESVAQQISIINARPYHVAKEQLPLWELILSALLGGLILNVMPCVLPVIPLKVLSMVQQSKGDRRWAIVHALVFSLGIISLFAFLAVGMGIYRAVTHQHLMYGMQYGNPEFLLILGLVVLALALSMLGVWTITPPRAVANVEIPRTGLMGSYAMGLLATILATPCSAPYLGPLLAITLGQPTAVMVLFFMLIGVGMAIPYIILAAFPQWLNRLPRAGRWSEMLKQGLGLVMVGVAVYLLCSLQTHHELMVALAIAVVLAAVCWAWGQLAYYSMPMGRIWSIRAGALIIGLVLSTAIWVYNDGLAGRTVRYSGQWQPFTLARLDKGLAQHRPVVVDFTASWCINCKFIKHFVLDAPPVRSGFKRAGALLLRADLSQDPPVEKALLYKLGWRSIPVLAIFSPEHPYTPVVLHDIYSQQSVIAAVRKSGN